jgi:phospholipase/lecithinase/hemolysin
LRRALLLAASATALLLAACGGSDTVESQLNPSRIVVFGDNFASIDPRYTINNSSAVNWTERLASRYGRTLAASASGGTSYAAGDARIAAVQQQSDAFLAGNSFAASDLVIINAGTADILAELAEVDASSQSQDQMKADVIQAGSDMAAQVRRLVSAGAKQVAVVGPYDLGKSPLAIETSRVGLLSEASGLFINGPQRGQGGLKANIADLGANVLFVDLAFYYNLVVSSPGTYGLSNATAGACLDSNQTPSCTDSTLKSGVDPAVYLFADRIYPTAAGNRLFGDWAFERIRERW